MSRERLHFSPFKDDTHPATRLCDRLAKDSHVGVDVVEDFVYANVVRVLERVIRSEDNCRCLKDVAAQFQQSANGERRERAAQILTG